MKNRKSITEEDIRDQLKRGDWLPPPLTVEDVKTSGAFRDTGLDALITLGWQGKTFRFGAEIRRLWTPKAIKEAANQVLRNASAEQLSPMIVVPYLGEERLRELELRGISGIDLCGNGVVVVPGKLLVFRTGSPNRYRWEGQIKNVYRGTSALVARVFLLISEFPSAGEVLDQIRALGGEVTLPTVSKVCKRLEQDLVIERSRGETPRSRRLRLLQPEKLLDLLRDHYELPDVTRSLSGKFAGPAEVLVERLLAWDKKGERRVVLTGASSVQAYAVMAREPVQMFYCSDAADLKSSLGEDFKETERFANVQLLQTQEEFVYFDRRPGLMASPMQTYLELATGEKREKETAEQVRRFILSQLPAKQDRR